MLKNVTVSIPEEALRWARRKAADENTSVSRLLGKMIDEEMRRSEHYWQAYEQWKELMARGPMGHSKGRKFSREETYERRR